MRELSNNKNKLSPLKSEQLLTENESRYKLLVDNVKDYAIFMLDLRGCVATWNEGAKRIKGYEEEEIIGHHFSIFYSQQSIAAQYPEFELTKALEDGRFEDEGWRFRKDGSRFWAHVIISPAYDENKQHIGFTKITRDLSERVRNEALMEKNMQLHRVNTDLDNFVYTASHDLKSPITNLEGLLSLVEKKIGPKLDESDRQLIEMMGTSIQKLNNTINSLAEVTKAQKNLDDRVEVVSFPEILAEIKEEIALLISAAKVEIQEAFAVKEVRFTNAGLRSILYNLLSNAIKYRSPDRPPKIKISTFTEEDKTILSIQDNGLGLTKKQEATLFSMFRRFHNHVEGSGIGLYIVKRTMESKNGQIEVHSRLNEGTEFKLYFSS